MPILEPANVDKSTRRGTVYIAEAYHEYRTCRGVRFIGYWEEDVEGRPTFIENGPGWMQANDAVRWGRERAPVVIVRVNRPHPEFYSAGTQQPPSSDLPEWKG